MFAGSPASNKNESKIMHHYLMYFSSPPAKIVNTSVTKDKLRMLFKRLLSHILLSLFIGH